ncbi:TonB-dependent receptor [Puia sp.]|uniref:TonB-dependent receptor n=1 Tax=Puia sp. TaxID=2045100 RepID=UPI002F3E81B1
MKKSIGLYMLLLLAVIAQGQVPDTKGRPPDTNGRPPDTKGRPPDKLDTVQVTGHALKKDQLSTAVTTALSGTALEQVHGLSLGESLKTLAGINSLQTGPTIFKPVIHGVYSNRILILNNGVRQEGQNWGNDHAPEIDPFIATKITVIKGPASIRYGSDAIGGVILVEPKALPQPDGRPGQGGAGGPAGVIGAPAGVIGGRVDVVGMTNGLSGAVSGDVEGAAGGKWAGLSFRVQGTLKKAGNAEAANYYLGNTGYNENDYSATLRFAREKQGMELYYSRFDTKLGIAAASHIGTVQDLLSAIARPEPAVKADFTDAIGRPYQTVDHQLLKAEAFWKLGKLGRLEEVFARQVDTRKEYDADISFNDSLAKVNPPDLYFRLTTYTNDLVWQHPAIGGRVVGSLGVNYLTHGNLQQGTGYQELIPNFVDYGGGAFLIEKAEVNRLTVEAGLRYDYRWLRAYTIDTRSLQEQRPTYSWSRMTATAGATYRFDEHFSVDYNFGTAWRPPQVIELFADGIHQSAVDYEHGDSTLRLETAYNNTLAFVLHYGPLSIEAGGYVNYFRHYIYLRPDAPKVQATIQGAFPSFTYTQTNALFQGLDLTVGYSFLRHFTVISKTSVVRARNVSTDDWLIGIPSDKFDNTLKYEWASLGKKVKGFFVSVNSLAVPKQVRVPANLMDFAPPPDGYILWGAAAGCSVPVGRKWMDWSLTVSNLTNVAYRDYMDRFRYFIDEMGRNVTLRVSVPF